MTEEFVLKVKTDYQPKELVEKLRGYEPWGPRIDFDNGVSTKDLKRRTPFAENTLQKLSSVTNYIPFESLEGGHLLDIGCNSGYNSIFVATKYAMKPVGVDVMPRHIEVAEFLADMSNVEGEFILASAEEFCRPQTFDVVLHFGTLYHLKNPLLSLEKTFENLKPGGYLALETQVYDHPDDQNICYFMHMQNNDPTNFWALSTKVLKECLVLTGFENVEIVKKVVPGFLEENMARILIVAQKPKDSVNQ